MRGVMLTVELLHVLQGQGRDRSLRTITGAGKQTLPP
ncbi:Uncharacterised protein [Vibrio cholerae]|nr:Uncharacterised protein [Vibrio cholerae]